MKELVGLKKAGSQPRRERTQSPWDKSRGPDAVIKFLEFFTCKRNAVVLQKGRCHPASVTKSNRYQLFWRSGFSNCLMSERA